jgi:hypothetical protein
MFNIFSLIRAWTKVSLIGIVAIVLVITITIILDLVLGLGYGYKPSDLAISLLILSTSALIYVVIRFLLDSVES